MVLLVLTAVRVFVLYPVDGVATWDQAEPFQWSITAFASRKLGSVFEWPTAQALVSEVEATAVSAAFSPVGGAVTVVQVP